MGASSKSDRQICGNILINIKTIKNKNKIYTFHCVFCSTNCDQLKKFSKHLEEHHLQNFENDVSEEHEKSAILLFEPEEIKVEKDLLIESFTESDKKIVNISKGAEIYEDPLNTDKSQLNNQIDCVKEEPNESVKEEKEVPSSITETEVINDNTSKRENYNLSIKDISSDDFSDDSDDVDFDIEDEEKTVEVTKKNEPRKIYNLPDNKSTKEVIDNDANKTLNANKPKKRRRAIIKTLLPTLIKQYKKSEILWQVNNISYGIKNKKYEVYGKIVDNLKLEPNAEITVEDVKHHINYINELYTKDREQELKCQMENTNFVPEYELYRELSFLSESQGPFLCTVCNELLAKYDVFCKHMAKHNGTQAFKCPSCDMMLSNYQKYLTHKKRHLGIFNFHCNICGKGYLFKNDLEWHVTSHTGDKPYLCQICGAGFRARHGYDNHVRRHEERFRHECHICKRGFNQLHALNNHIKSHLNIRDVICKICGKGFVHTKYLKRHELIHGDVKNYKCNECGKAFFQACGLRAHRKNHHF